MEKLNMEELDFNNIMTDDADIASLFGEAVEDNGSNDSQEEKEKQEENETTEVSVEDLFSGKSESVGSDNKDIQETEDTDPSKDGSSPDFYPSITAALVDEGVFQDLDEETVNNVKTGEDFLNLIRNQISKGLDEKQKRIDEALGLGVEPSEIQKYENVINYLDGISEEAISDETEKGETLRKQLIFQDFINRGYSKERAQREVQKSFNAGSDIEDAKEALESNKDFYSDSYNSLIKEAKLEKENYEKEQKKQAEALKNSILKDEKIFGDLSVDNTTRKKIYDNISKPIYKDPDSGEYLTAIQKYEKENHTEFLKNLGLIYTLTDGFKNIDGLIKNKVKKEVNKGLSKMEQKLANTSRNSDGSLKFVTNVRDDKDSYLGKGWSIDV